VIDITAAARAMARIRAVRLKSGIAGAVWTFLCALTGHEQRAPVQEALLAA